MPILISDDTRVRVYNSVNTIHYIEFTFIRTGSTDNPLTIFYRFTDSNNVGAISAKIPIVIPAGSNTTTLTINPRTTNLTQLYEAISLTLVDSADYAVDTITPIIVNIIKDVGVSVSATISTADENSATNLVYTFTRTGYNNYDLVVNYILSGSCTNGFDYALLPDNIIIPAGSDTATLIIDPTSDNIVEFTETISVELLDDTEYIKNTVNPVVVNIINFELVSNIQVSVTASTATIVENEVLNATYTFTRSGSTANPLTINYTLGGTAVNGVDYELISTSAIFATNSSTTTLVINPIVDNVEEETETISLNLINGSGYISISINPVIINLLSNTIPVDVSLFATNTNITEDGNTNSVYTFTRNGDITNPLTVNYILGGTATTSADYVAVGNSIIFGANSATSTLVIVPIVDADSEATETVSITLVDGSGYVSITPDPVSINILDSTTALPEITTVASTTSIVENEVVNATYTFTRSGSTTNPLTINYTLGGTATDGVDYTVINSSVIIAAGSATAELIIDPTIDNVAEPTENIQLTVLGSSEYTVITPNPVTINLNDSLAGVIMNAANFPVVVENDDFIGTFTLQRTGSNTNPLTINYTLGGTAVNGVDYELLDNTVTFTRGSEYAFITIRPILDALNDGSETVTITLVAGGGYEILTPDIFIMTIIDPTDVSVVANANNTGFTFTRTDGNTSIMSVNYILGGIAVNGIDYELVDTVITFDNNNILTTELIITPITGAFVEGNKTVTLTLVSGNNYLIATPDPVSISIIDV